MNIGARIGCWSGGLLPHGYDAYDFLITNGNACLIIPHTHVNNNNIRITTSIKFFSDYNTRNRNLFQGAINDSKWMGGFYSGKDAKSYLYIGSFNGYDKSVGLEQGANKEGHVSICMNNGICQYDIDGSTGSVSCGVISLGRMGIFTQTNGGVPVSGRIPTNVGMRYFEYFDGEDYHCKLIPAKSKTTGECGFYDVINREFLTAYGGASGLTVLNG